MWTAGQVKKIKLKKTECISRLGWMEFFYLHFMCLWRLQALTKHDPTVCNAKSLDEIRWHVDASVTKSGGKKKD